MRAVLGPCIRPADYEFGADALARLVARLGADGRGAHRRRRARARPARRGATSRSSASGVDAVDDLDVCTVESPDHFSYRRDGVTGRQAVVAVVVSA